MSDEELATGWEDTTPSEDSLLLASVRCQADRAVQTVAGADGGRLLRGDGFVATDKSSPFLFENIAVLTRPPGDAEAAQIVDDLAAWYPAGTPWVLMSAWRLPDVSEAGLVKMGHPPFMVRAAGGAAPPTPSTLRIVEVDDDAGVADYVSTLVDAFPVPPLAGIAPRAVFPAVDHDRTRKFVGYEDGRPVATALAYVDHGLNWVEWVSSRQECRGRGYGAAITWAATMADPTLPAALIASDLGQSVYSRMGYLRLHRWTLWFAPGSSGQAH